MHQVGDQPRLYYDARSTSHQYLLLLCLRAPFLTREYACPSRASLCLQYIHYYRLCVYNGTIIVLYNNTQCTHGFRQYRAAAECAGSCLASNYDVTQPLERPYAWAPSCLFPSALPVSSHIHLLGRVPSLAIQSSYYRWGWHCRTPKHAQGPKSINDSLHSLAERFLAILSRGK